MNNLKRHLLFLFFVTWQFCKIRCAHITIFPYEKECFYFHADKQNLIVGSYEILDGGDSCNVTIREGKPSGEGKKENILFSSYRYQEKFQLKVLHKGVYSFCYDNGISMELTFVFTLRIKESAHEISESDLSTIDDVQKINEATHDLYEMFLEVSDEQDRMLEISDLFSRVNEKIHSKLILWSEIQIVCTIVLTIVHLYFIKSFFEIKTIV